MSRRSSREAAAAELGALNGAGRPAWYAVPLGFLKRASNGVNKRLARLLLKRWAGRSRHRLSFNDVGAGEGAWSVPVAFLQPNWIAYCVGVGTNATFDQELAERYGLKVFSIDPTPVAIKHMGSLPRDEERHAFLPVGVWNCDTTLRLYAPMSLSANLSVRDIHGTGRYIDLPCKTLSTIMREQGHDSIDLLKIDIEGSWYEVIEDCCRKGIAVTILCAEFDSPTSPWKAFRAVRMLRSSGLELVHAERENLTFVRTSLLV